MKIRIPLVAALGAAAVLTAGCASRPPAINVERAAAVAVGLPIGDPIVFHTVGEPLDLPSTRPATLSVYDALRLSILHSPQLQAALARVRVAQADAQQSRLLPNPILSIGLRFPTSASARPVIDAGITADLLAILRRPGAIRAADANLRAACAAAVTTALDVSQTAQETYYAIQSSEAMLNVLRERGDLLQRLHDLAQSRLRIGEGTRLDVVTLQTKQVELESEIADKKLELNDQRLQLARLIGRPNSKSDWTIPVWKKVAPLALSEWECLQTARRHRPELQEREWELAALGAEHQLARWGPFSGTDGGVTSERDEDWTLGPAASIPLPIFDTGQAARDRASALLVESRHNLTAAGRRIVEEVRRAFAMLAGTQANLDRVQQQLIPLQTLQLQQTEAQFRAGQSDVTALLIAEQDMRTSKAKEIELQHRVAVAQVKLERAVGGAGSMLTTPLKQPTKPGNSQ